MKKWEYRLEYKPKRNTFLSNDELLEWLNQLGQEGWKLCAISDVYIFRREILI